MLREGLRLNREDAVAAGASAEGEFNSVDFDCRVEDADSEEGEEEIVVVGDVVDVYPNYIILVGAGGR